MSLHILASLFAESIRGDAQLTATALIAGLWQGVLLSAATGLTLRVLPKTTAALRFVVWAIVFCVAVAMPFVNLHGARFAGHGNTAAVSQVNLDPRWSYLLAAIWLAASLYRLGELLVQGVGLRSLWKSAVPVEPDKLAQLEVPLAIAGKRIELCISSEVDRPSVIGFFSPRILVPEWLFTELSVVELNHIVLHEMEHLRRRDEWVNLLQKIGLVLLPLNPVLFWIDRRLSTERELACDDGVLKRTHMPRSYAASLASIAERRLDSRTHRHMGALALAATGLKRRRSELGLRIESILGGKPPANSAFARGMAAILVAGVVGSAAALARAPQLVSFRSETSLSRSAMPAQTTAAAHLAISPVKSTISPEPTAQFRNVSFHPRMRAAVRNANAAAPKVPLPETVSQISEGHTPAPVRQQFVMLTSWEDAPVSRVVVQTPDGKFFLAPYAAVSTQAGWLLVQL